MTVEPDNRSEAVGELRKLGTVSITKVPLENEIGPVYKINAQSSDNIGLMVAGQIGTELDYKYFVMLESGSNQIISGGGYMYQGSGGSSISTTIVHSITVAYTNDEEFDKKYNVYECSSLLDGYTFVTKGGRGALWTLFGVTLAGGTAIMLSALAVDEYPDWDDPNYDSKREEAKRKMNGRLIGGGILMGVSILFTIPLW
jgi:hypothetical protein